jgi:hypothetical protein
VIGGGLDGPGAVIAGDSNRAGLEIYGGPSGPGLRCVGGDSGGAGIKAEGGSGGGPGIQVSVTSGIGIDIDGTTAGMTINASAGDALEVTSTGGARSSQVVEQEPVSRRPLPPLESTLHPPPAME